MLKKTMRPISLMLLVSFCLVSFHVPYAQAKMISTNSLIAEQQMKDQRAQVKQFLAQEDVAQLLTQYGVNPVDARNRVDSLSNQELAEIAQSIDKLPAGGDGVGSVAGAVVFIFLVLLFTDLLGLTNVFNFAHHH